MSFSSSSRESRRKEMQPSSEGQLLPPPEISKRSHSAMDEIASSNEDVPASKVAKVEDTKPLEKSTVTTTTSSVTQMNVYDAVLAEASDLWQAASEAQQLGRLKMASSYLLLLHARLVGLGKRFDKVEQSEGVAERVAVVTATDPSPRVLATPTKAVTTGNSSSSNSNNSKSILTPNTAMQLSEMLPDDIELDQVMMEHLAKAAAELHAARSGRKRHATEWNPGMTGYDYPTPRNGPTPANELEYQQWQHQLGNRDVSNTGIVWSLGEIRILQQALEEATELNPPDAVALAKQLGRNPAQVKAFLRNQDTKTRIAAGLALEGGAANDRGTESDTPRRKGGRGPKPPTTAIHTVPNAMCNAQMLLEGHFLSEEYNTQDIDDDGNVEYENGEDEEKNESAEEKDKNNMDTKLPASVEKEKKTTVK